MWGVLLHRTVEKAVKKLGQKQQDLIYVFLLDLEKNGPYRTNWKNYTKEKGHSKKQVFHCHLKKGHPTYVVCWELLDEKLKLIKVTYVGTHEKAPY